MKDKKLTDLTVDDVAKFLGLSFGIAWGIVAIICLCFYLFA